MLTESYPILLVHRSALATGSRPMQMRPLIWDRDWFGACRDETALSGQGAQR